MPLTLEQRDTALAKANVVRVEIKRLRERVLSGEESLAGVILDPPECVKNVPLHVLVTLGRSTTRYKSGANTWMERMGQAAMRADVNLFIVCGRSSMRSRQWMVDWLRTHPGCVRKARLD